MECFIVYTPKPYKLIKPALINKENPQESLQDKRRSAFLY